MDLIFFKEMIILHKRNHEKKIHLFSYNTSILGIPDAGLSLPRKCLSSQAWLEKKEQLWWKEALQCLGFENVSDRYSDPCLKQCVPYLKFYSG